MGMYVGYVMNQRACHEKDGESSASIRVTAAAAASRNLPIIIIITIKKQK